MIKNNVCMTWIDKLQELKKLKRNYLLFICLDDMEDVPESLANEVSSICVQIDKIESMPMSNASQEIKTKLITFESKL